MVALAVTFAAFKGALVFLTLVVRVLRFFVALRVPFECTAVEFFARLPSSVLLPAVVRPVPVTFGAEGVVMVLF